MVSWGIFIFLTIFYGWALHDYLVTRQRIRKTFGAKILTGFMIWVTIIASICFMVVGGMLVYLNADDHKLAILYALVMPLIAIMFICCMIAEARYKYCH